MDSAGELWLSTSEAVLVVVTAVGVYAAAVVFSRIFGQRQFASSSTYDLVFTFALGSVIGRVVLVRTSLAAAVLGLAALFLLHAVTGWLHHHVGWVHDLIQNQPVLLVDDGRVREQGLVQARMSRLELEQALRLRGVGSLGRVRAAVLERNGAVSVLTHDDAGELDAFTEVQGAEQLTGPT